MAKLQLVSPWVNYYHKLNAFFRGDHDVTVVYDEQETEVKIYVIGNEKASSLEELLLSSRELGTVTLKITVIPVNYTSSTINSPYGRGWTVWRNMNDTQKLFMTALRDNPAFSFTDRVCLQTNEITYIVFKNEVVQYCNDDIGDYYGQCSTLYQHIAAEIFNPINGVRYCTDKPDRYNDEY